MYVRLLIFERQYFKQEFDSNNRITTRDDAQTSSMSALTDASELSSLSSINSSKATTPIDSIVFRRKSGPDNSPIRNHAKSNGLDRIEAIVEPKSSIPSHLSAADYAAECIRAAEASRLNPYALHLEEYLLLRHHISHTQVTTYLNIRNGILRLWMEHPWKAVSRQEAIGCANARWFDAASVCYDWLIRQGYLNFGCLDLSPCVPALKQSPRKLRGKTIAVIGAGISGLACARQLESLFKQYSAYFQEEEEEPPKIIILEGRSRIGGRVYSREFKTKERIRSPTFAGKRYTAEMGGMIITGFDQGNPMNVLVRGQLGLPYHGLRAETTIYDTDGQPVDTSRDELVEKLYNDCLDRVSEFKFKPPSLSIVEGNQDLIDEGRDSPGDGSRTIMQAEEAEAALSDTTVPSQQNGPNVKTRRVASDSATLNGPRTEPGTAGSMDAVQKVKEMGWALRSDAPQTSQFNLDGAVKKQSATLGSVLDHAITQYGDLVDLTAQDYRLINWHIANLEYSNATNLHNLSLPLWDIDAGNEWDGQHSMVVGGYQSVARGLLHSPSPLNLTTKFPVKTIRYHSEGFGGAASIECEDGTVVEADAVVCSIPLGVLKHGNVEFDPPLPSWKTGAVERLGFGILNKVILVYESIFWESDRHIFGVLRDAEKQGSLRQNEYGRNRGRFFQWFNVTNTTGLPCLIALMAGDAGFETETSSNDELVAEATSILRTVFGKEVPHPVEAVVTHWGSDRFARGSYSSAAPNMQTDDYDIMARPIGNLFFAGEHTIGTHPATVHGAYLSGLRAASEVLDEVIGPIEIPTPLILPKDSVLLHKRKESAKDPIQARIDAYEAELWEYVRTRLGERPVRPSKVSGNAFLLFSKAKFDVAKRLCDENRQAGAKPMHNEVRAMTSRMWKDISPEERKPFEDQAAEQKQAYTTAIKKYVELSEKWDLDAISLRASYENEHPFGIGQVNGRSSRAAPKHRRGRTISYAEDHSSDLEF
ncbi:hypothetical protein VHEMI10492 [[Torrubiella] hemipterigena]|uniref:Lysine-specific histone demethylase 1 n=1 Tax=[Torrubiella] hemipterigena TaxID=1531966 RepID=A0A0A1TS91_9HYPO|nr:hypothetical protein VHEMI10492 [[Torrubiella] hemipterigena]